MNKPRVSVSFTEKFVVLDISGVPRQGAIGFEPARTEVFQRDENLKTQLADCILGLQRTPFVPGKK